MRFTILGAVVTLGSLAVTGCTVTIDSQGQIVREERRFEVTGPVDLRLTTFDGSISVEAWDKPDVRVEVEKRGPTREAIEGLQIVASQEGNTIEFEVKAPREETFGGLGITRSATARLIVSIPARSDVRARSGDGSISVDGLNGRLELRTGDGSIKVHNVSGEMTLVTGDGSVSVQEVEGRLDVETSDGGVNVSGMLAAVKLHTGDGTIVLRAEPGSVMKEDWELTTGDGGVSLYLPESFGADIDAQTGDGTIRSEFVAGRMAERDDSQGRSNRSLRAQVGSGGMRLKIRTEDGSIRIRRH